MSAANIDPHRLPLARHFPPPHAHPNTPHVVVPVYTVIWFIPSRLTLKLNCTGPPPSEPQTAVGRGRRAGSWRGCALMGSGTEPAGCVTPLPGERPLKCVLELARRPSAARRAAVCKGKPSWCPLRASARRRRERLPEASSHWQTGLSRCLANEHSDPQPPKQSGWGGGAALTTAPGPETQAAPQPHGQPPLTYGRLFPLLPSLKMAQNAGSAVWLRWVLNGLQ